jgi:sterol desaturase/sphingolipid hydroxylase (fatty acid hydroxylase superfamily)
LLLTIFIFDFAIYWQHRLFHRFSFLWKFHCIHHSDRQLNITSGLRFHFGELIISNFYKSSLIVLLSINFEYYLIYETFLTGFSLFNHSNIKINNKIEYLLSFVIVTPKVHRTHHSVEHTLMNSNFGNLFVFWDKFFKTFSTAVCQKMGLTSFPDDNNLKKLLMSPFT